MKWKSKSYKWLNRDDERGKEITKRKEEQFCYSCRKANMDTIGEKEEDEEEEREREKRCNWRL